MGTKDLTHEAIAEALSHDRPLTHEQRGVLLGLVIDDKKWQREYDAANSERNDLALFAGRLIRRMRAARTGQGMAAGDEALEQQVIGYLRRKGLVSPLRADCGEAGHDEGKCGNAACLGD